MTSNKSNVGHPTNIISGNVTSTIKTLLFHESKSEKPTKLQLDIVTARATPKADKITGD